MDDLLRDQRRQILGAFVAAYLQQLTIPPVKDGQNAKCKIIDAFNSAADLPEVRTYDTM